MQESKKSFTLAHDKFYVSNVCCMHIDLSAMISFISWLVLLKDNQIHYPYMTFSNWTLKAYYITYASYKKRVTIKNFQLEIKTVHDKFSHTVLSYELGKLTIKVSAHAFPNTHSQANN